MHNLFIFKLDNADYPYTIRDLPLVKPEMVQGEVEVEIAKYDGLCNVVVMPVGKKFDASRISISERLGTWMTQRNKNELDRLKKDFSPNTDEVQKTFWYNFSYDI